MSEETQEAVNIAGIKLVAPEEWAVTRTVEYYWRRVTNLVWRVQPIDEQMVIEHQSRYNEVTTIKVNRRGIITKVIKGKVISQEDRTRVPEVPDAISSGGPMLMARHFNYESLPVEGKGTINTKSAASKRKQRGTRLLTNPRSLHKHRVSYVVNYFDIIE
jgi:hypothetical protein